MKTSSSDADSAASSCRVMPAAAARSPTRSVVVSGTRITGRPWASGSPGAGFSPAAASAACNCSSCGPRTRTDCRARPVNSATEQSAISRPRPMTTRWSAVSDISVSRWLDTNTVRPSAASLRMNPRIHTMPSGSRPLTGSSNSSVCGSPIRAPASPSRCDIPSEKPPARFLATEVSPTVSSTSSTRAAGIRLLAASHRRWDRALRLGCTHRASSSAPTCRSGCSRSR